MLHWKSGISRPGDFGNPAGPRKIDLCIISYTNHLTLLMENLVKESACVNLSHFVLFIVIIIILIVNNRRNRKVGSFVENRPL